MSVVMPLVRDGAGRVLGEFTTADAMLTGVDALVREGYRTLETFTPFDMPELDERLGLRRSRIGWLVAAGGLVGMVLAYGIQWWANVHDYPLNSGGRPVHAAPAFLLATFEGTVLFAAFAAFFGLMIWLRLPKLWAPIDEVEDFGRSSVDRFWIAVGIPAGASGAGDGGARAIEIMRGAGALRTVGPVRT
jgi:ActD protein